MLEHFGFVVQTHAPEIAWTVGICFNGVDCILWPVGPTPYLEIGIENGNLVLRFNQGYYLLVGTRWESSKLPTVKIKLEFCIPQPFTLQIMFKDRQSRA